MLERRAEELGYDIAEEREWWKENVPETPWPSYLKNAVQDAENCAVVDEQVPDVLPEPVEEDDDTEDDYGENTDHDWERIRDNNVRIRNENTGSGKARLLDRMNWVRSVEPHLGSSIPVARLLWRLALMAWNPYDVVWASSDELARESGLSRASVKRSIHALQKMGILRTYRRRSPAGGFHHVNQLCYRSPSSLKHNDPFPICELPGEVDSYIRSSNGR